MKNFSEVLKKCPLFCDVEIADLFSVLKCIGTKKQSYEKGEVIFKEGSSVTAVGVVLSGAVRIERTDWDGNKSIVASVFPSELFGETFALAKVTEIPVLVVATEKTEVLLVEVDRIVKTCSNACAFHSQLILNLLKVVADKNLFFNRKLEILSRRTTREKLMAYLLSQAKLTGSNTFTIPYDRQGLADYLQVDRSGLSMEISKLIKEKIIDSHRSTFTVLSRDGFY